MENKTLHQIWDQQAATTTALEPQEIIKKAAVQQNKQKIGIAVMGITTAILIAYAIWQFPQEINMFIVGLCIMIASLFVRIVIEIKSNWRKAKEIVQLDGKHYLSYLKAFYTKRKRIHFVVTPLCFGAYIFGLWQLFPYFKAEFSSGFYTYLIVSATLSLLVVGMIIINQVKKELRFLKTLV